jgi:hypothetical protein
VKSSVSFFFEPILTYNSTGPGTAFDFALKIAENLVGEAKAEEVAKGMLWNWQK